MSKRFSVDLLAIISEPIVQCSIASSVNSERTVDLSVAVDAITKEVNFVVTHAESGKEKSIVIFSEIEDAVEMFNLID